MTRLASIWLRAMFMLVLLVLMSCRPAPRVFISTQQGREVQVSVEIADSPAKRELGLQYRRDLKEDEGMLFLFSAPSVQTFWMKNTPLSLDLIFIGSHQRIVGIIHEATPFSTSTLAVSAPSQYVLEVRGGLARRWGIGAGDPVRFEGVPLEGMKGNP